MSKYLLPFTFILVVGFAGFFIGQNVAEIEPKVFSETKPNALNSDLKKLLNDEKIKFLKTFEDRNDKKFIGIVRRLDKPVEKGSLLSTSEQLNIYDEMGNSVYEFKDFSINKIEFARFLPDYTQMIIETNSGGTDDILTIISLEDGKFTELEIEGDTQLRGGWWTMPEYRSNEKGAYFKPAQLIVIQQIGGADSNPKASVFRNKNNKFQKVGEISINEIGDSIEKQLNK